MQESLRETQGEMDFVKCCFSSESLCSENVYTEDLQLFYAETSSVISRKKELTRLLSPDEKLRALRFLSEDDRETYIASHSLLRLLISGFIDKSPADLGFLKNSYGKPFLNCNPVFFNLSHTKGAFAFVITKTSCVGVDLEEINRDFDINSIAGMVFSQKEKDYIFKTAEGSKDRFFRLWTRKEAFLKALGSGIVKELPEIEVCEKINLIDPKHFEDDIVRSAKNEHFIYSAKIDRYFLSIAVTHKVNTRIMQLEADNIDFFLKRAHEIS